MTVVQIVKGYPELRESAFWIQLPMYVHHYKRSILAGHFKIFRGMEPSVKCMFPAIEKLQRLL